jgi:hypothetical protein
MTRRLVDAGAKAVVLTGSHARSAAGPDSDIDITAIGDDPDGTRMEVLDSQLFSVAWRTERTERLAMRDPARAGAAVPAWRSVQILHDPRGVAAALQREARAWRWEDLGAAGDTWVAEQVTGFAEEVHKLVAARRRDDTLGIALQAGILALRLGPIMAVAERILYESENVLWHLLDERLGEPWRSTQALALGIGAPSDHASVAASLELYRLVAAAADPFLDERQRTVVERALALIASSEAEVAPDSGSGVGFVGIRTNRFKEMVGLFRELIGLPVIREGPGATWFRLGAHAELHVYGESDPDHAFFTTGPVVGLRVVDVDGARVRLLDAGLEMLTDVERTATAAWCHFRAPDGTVLEIIGPS